MTMAPGWYDAGTPGRVRWWDGVQWTAHEAEARPQKAAVDDQPSSLGAPPMGWYETSEGSPRWWDGSRWTSFRMRGGIPGADWAATEQPAVAWVFGSMFFVFGLAQFGLALLIGAISAGGSITTLVLWASGPLTLAQAAIFLSMAAKTTAVRRIPVPRSSPAAIDAVRPLPGEQEGLAAGWYSVAPRVTRWWTGARWSEYIGTQHGVRPTFTGARTLRIVRLMGWTIIGIGALGFIGGAALIAFGVNADDHGFRVAMGVLALVGGIMFGILGAACFVMSRRQRHIFLRPQSAPNTASAQNLDEQDPGVQH
jgi:hypothetical protein